ncbi:YbbR-like domain-containing protein [Cytobacillus sp. FJAT-54145]|uniref:YbbR-like domain-containing protein n=1 Tax=Cytobacillus spartinae TaxID=3299023 RepID=A0ABW6KNB6_9BACI
MDKYIDKLIDSRWFMKVVALVLAMLLFENVYDGNQDSAVNVPQDQESETIANVPVKTYYDTENLVVSGIPETVTLTIEGPKANLQQVKTQQGFEVYVDLTNAEIGTQRVPILIRDISDKVEVTIDPGFANISVQEKVTREFSVEAEFDSKLLDTGYIAEQAKVEPNKVRITGAKDVVDRITYVKAALDVKGPIKEDVTTEANILVLDRQLNKLDVIVEPETVDVTVPIKALSKTVPIQLVENGTPPSGITIDSISLGEDEATIIAARDVLEKTESVRVELDVSKIQNDTVVTLPVIISEGIVEVDPETIEVTIKVNKNEDVTFSNLPIKTEGLSEQYNVTFTEPTNGVVNLTVSGSSDIISQLSESDFNLFINLSNLDTGNHDVEINVTAPENIRWTLGRETARISITEKEV